jgi:thiamine-phosphate pyrophosphorylase
MIKKVREHISKPLVAIGGITLDRASDVMAAGADAVAVLSGILEAENITQQAKKFCRRLG